MKTIMKTIIGKLFSLPLRTEGFGVGLIAKQNKDILLGYFFNKYYSTNPKTIQDCDFEKDNVCLIAIFGALGFKKEEWKIIGDIPFWNENDWEVPLFKQKDPILGSYNAIYYSNDLKEIKRQKISEEEAHRYYKSGVYGYGAIEIALTKLLNPRGNVSD